MINFAYRENPKLISIEINVMVRVGCTPHVYAYFFKNCFIICNINTHTHRDTMCHTHRHTHTQHLLVENVHGSETMP